MNFEELLCDIESVKQLKERLAARQKEEDEGGYTLEPFTVDPDLISKIVSNMEVYSIALGAIRFGMPYLQALNLAVMKVHYNLIVKDEKGGSNEST